MLSLRQEQASTITRYITFYFLTIKLGGGGWRNVLYFLTRQYLFAVLCNYWLIYTIFLCSLYWHLSWLKHLFSCKNVSTLCIFFVLTNVYFTYVNTAFYHHFWHKLCSTVRPWQLLHSSHRLWTQRYHDNAFPDNEQFLDKLKILNTISNAWQSKFI